MKSLVLKKTAGDQNFIGALILVIVAVTVGVLYRNQMSDVINNGITKVRDLVNNLFANTGAVNSVVAG